MRVQTSNTRRMRDGAQEGIALPLLRVDGIDYNLETLPRVDLMELVILLGADIDNIQLQIDSGHTGAWGDPGWEPRARFAQKMKRRQVELVQAELSRRKEKVSPLAQFFVDRAFNQLPEELFRTIMDAAKSSYNEAVAGA